MSTRNWIIGALSSLALSATQAFAQQVYELKVSHYLPPNHTFQTQLVKWGEELEKESNGRLKLRIYPDSQLGPINRQFDLARSGVADIAVGLHGATPGRFPMSELVSLPYAAPSAGSTSAIASRRLTELAPKYLAQEHVGLKILWMAVTNPLMFLTTKKPIETVDDFKGLRIRYAGKAFEQIITQLGASPLAVPPGDTQDSLAKGIIDGATFPYEAMQSFDLGTVAKYVLQPGVSSATFAVVMNQKKFDSLPPDLQALIVRTTGPEMAGRFGAAWDVAEQAGHDYMVSKGVKITTFSGPEFAAVKEKLQPITTDATDALEKVGKPAKEFLDAYRK